MYQEIQALNANNTWELVPPPKDKKPIDYEWVYNTKQKANGS